MRRLTRRQLFGLVPCVALSAVSLRAQAGRRLQVYKDPTCGCCSQWVRHMQEHGFTATVSEAREMTTVKQTYHVPDKVRSCHTTVVDGYVIEGHVPAADVQRLLKERPKIVGIGVPGMPIGSPGMEVAGVKAQAFDVLSFDKAGGTAVFASHRG